MQQSKRYLLIQGTILTCLTLSFFFPLPMTVQAASIDVEALAWNIVGLDSNKPENGPNHFPVGARVCNNTGGPISNVKADFIWDNTTNSTFIYERPGTNTSITLFAPPDAPLANGDCADFYFEVEVLKVKEAYTKSRRYHIEISSSETGASVFSTPRPRELFVEYLVSQSRNAVTDVQYGTSLGSLTSVPNGGTMSLVVGQTYYIRLIGFTATQGYNQLESFINFPNTIFQVMSVESVYTAPSAGYTIDKMYSDACGWDNVLSSPTYSSCIVSDDKTGGNITVTYEVKILSVPGGAFTNPEPLSTLIYDFSGSSYHYNADFGISSRYAYVLDPAAVNISKSFSPLTIAPGSTSTLTFTLKNTAPVTATGVSFEDHLPSLFDGTDTGQMVADPASFSASGCGASAAMDFAPSSNATFLSFSGGVIAPNGTCTVSVSVSVPDAPASGSYSNISENVFIAGLDSGDNATADLVIDASTVSAGAGVCGQKLVEWIMDPSQGTTSPPSYWPPTKNSSVDGTTTLASSGNGILTGISTVSTDGDPANSWWGSGFAKTGTPDPDTSPYLQFRVDTTNYTDLKMGFRVMVDPNWTPSATVYAYSSTTGLPGSFTLIGSHANLLASTYTTPTGTPWAASQTGSSSTYFRVYMIGANNAGSKVFLDNIVFTGCGPAQNPVLTKTFNTNPVVVGGTSTLTFHIQNPNSGSLTGVNFTDILPAGLTVPNGTTSTVTCDSGSGSGTLVATATDTITFTNGIIPGNTTCHITTPVAITAGTSGPHTNISGFISSTESGTNSDPNGSAKASLVALLPPAIDKSFNPGKVLANETSTLTFVLTNPNPSDALPNVSFTDTLPAGMTLASDVVTAQCEGSVSGTASTGVIAFSGGVVPAGGTCTVSAEVVASTLGDHVNTSGPVTTTIGGLTSGSDTATATLSVEAPNPAISILKRVSSSSTGPWSTFLTVAPGTNVYYQFTVENTGDVDLDGASVSDPTLSTLGLDLANCAWPSLPRYSDAVTCVTSSIPALEGNHPNAATAQAVYSVGGTTETAISSASYVGVTSGALNLSKQISTSPSGPWSTSIVDVEPGSTIYYRFTIVNATGGPLTSINVNDPDPAVDLTVCNFTDPLPNNGATTCVIPATVSISSVAQHTNTATAHGTDSGSNIVDSSPSSAHYTPSSPDLTVAKSNNTAGTGEIGEPFTWTVTISNQGTAAATFLDGQTVLSDQLPAGPTYENFVAPGLANLDCALAVTPDAITCTASGGDFSLAPGENFDVALDVTPASAGDLLNTATLDPGSNVSESDEENNDATDTVTVTNRTPTAQPDTNTAVENGPMVSGNVRDGGVAAGDNPDDQGDPPAAVTAADQGGATLPIGSAFSTAAGGSLTLNADGTYSYTPPSWNIVPAEGLAEVFNYTITDSDGDASSSTLTITVTDHDRMPLATNNSYNIDEGGTASGNLMTDGSPDTLGDPPATVTSFDATSANGGTVTVTADGTFTYNPNDYTGVDTFTYTITDMDGDPSSATVTVTVNALPDALDDNASTLVNTPVTTSNVLANDDLGDTPTTITAFDAASANGGTVSNNGDGTFDYNPPLGFIGTDAFTYTITDNDGDTSTASVFITVSNDPPVATDNLGAVDSSSPVHAANMVTDDEGHGVDSDPDGDPLSVTKIDGESDPLVDVAGTYGTLAWDTDGSYIYTLDVSDPDYLALPGGGTATDTFTYTLSDGKGGSDTATIIITVTGGNHPPTATDNAGAVDSANPSHSANMVTDDEGSGVDNDPDGDPLTVTQVDGETNPAADVPGTFGLLNWATDGSYAYTLNTSDPDYLVLAGGSTATETFPYTISDGNGGADTASIIVTITGADDSPIANSDSFSTAEDTPLSGDLKYDNGAGVDVPSGDGGNVWIKVSDPAHGTVTVNLDGSFTYTPGADYNGPDSFTYRICDADNDCDLATVNLTVTSVEEPAIGIAKRVADIARVGPGMFDVTLEFAIQNYGDVALSTVQVIDDLSAVFIAPSTFTVQSVSVSSQSNAALAANTAYDGSTDTSLLNASGSSIAVNGSASITVVVRVLPASSGPFLNSASASGETPGGIHVSDDSSDGTDPDNTTNCPGCFNGDRDPSNNTKSTEIPFDPNIFDPPFGLKSLDASGLPIFSWTMVWINDNNFPTVASVSDPIPDGTAYEASGSSSGYAVPIGAPAGSTNLGVSCTTDSSFEPSPGDPETVTNLCYYEGPTGAYPRGRIVWEGLLGPDLGATDQADANDELYITFKVHVASGVSSVQNTATIDADLNNDADLTDPGEQIVATARADWQEPPTPVDGQQGRRLPGTGFAPGKVTALPAQTVEQSYTDLGDLWLEIPTLGVRTPIVGVPKNAGVWDVDWLWEQAGWLQGTAFPTWQGNSVLTAHVYLPDGKPGSFVDLGELRFGNQVIVHAFGQRYIYEVRTNHIILPTDMSPFGHEEKAWLTLLTCKGFDENSGSYKYRVKVRAVLVKVEAEP